MAVKEKWYTMNDVATRIRMSISTARRNVVELGYLPKFNHTYQGQQAVNEKDYNKIISELVKIPKYANTVRDYIALDPKNNYMGKSGNVVVVYSGRNPLAVYTSIKNAKKYIKGIPNSKITEVVAGKSTLKGYTIKEVSLGEADKTFTGFHLNQTVTIYSSVTPTVPSEKVVLDLTTAPLFDTEPYKVKEDAVVVPYEVHKWLEKTLVTLARRDGRSEIPLDATSVVNCVHIALNDPNVSPVIRNYMETATEDFMRVPRVGYMYAKAPRYKVVLVSSDISARGDILLALNTLTGIYGGNIESNMESYQQFLFTLEELDNIDARYKAFAEEV